MKRLWSGLNLRDKFRWLAIIGLIIWLSNFSIVYFEIHGINRATVNLETREELYNSILEIRRYEKNFLLYHHRTSLNETLNQLTHAKQTLARLIEDTGSAKNASTLTTLRTTLGNYAKQIELLGKMGIDARPNEKNQDDIRAAGKQLVDLSFDILNTGKRHVAVAANRALRWPVISLGLMLILFTVGAVLINRKVVKPLTSLEHATKEIGRGNFGPLHHSVRIESEVDRLILAFNRMAEELETRQEQIVHSRKIASLGTLVSGVAHELNNPINNIILTIDSLLGKRQIADQRRQDMLNDILTQAIRASEIVKNLLDFSRSEKTVAEDLDIGRLISETITISQNQLTVHKIELIKNIQETLPTIRGNRQALQQVMINLLTNAVHAMPSGGQLSVAAAAGQNNRVIISVSDTGIGIADEDLSNIFDPFFTTKEVGKGTGLGLSVSYGIIKKHGGSISVESTLGKGSTFTITLPTKEDLING